MSDDTRNFFTDPFYYIQFDISEWADGIKDWAIANRSLIQPFKKTINDMIVWLEQLFVGTPVILMIVIIGFIAWQAAGRRVAIASVLCLVVTGSLSPEAWELTMITLAIVLMSVFFAVVVGLPLGILAGKSNTFQAIARPILDTMQTIPSFVYLVPVVMLIGIGNVAGVVVTMVFAVPPLVRLTSLGIRGVDQSVVEAARAFGASPMQILLRVELPLALRTIMAGFNQTLMLSLSMVVIASLVAVKGLGNEVLRAMGRLDAGKAIVGGLGIVLLAIVLDRITQGLGRDERERGYRHWWQGGPIGLVARLLGKN
ncbi:MAG: ABC transporter permease subunit [Pseudomonadota bacterium]